MSEYWKSTPSYWCKFCSTYIKDTGIERRNHESSAKHQNNIQRSLRELHKSKDREDREKQFAKDEVARLNGLVSGKPGERRSNASPRQSQNAASAVNVNTAQARKKQAEQLIALGVALPESLKKEVQGVGSYQVVSETAVAENAMVGTVNRSLADVLAEARQDAAREDAAIKDEADEDSKPSLEDIDRKRKFEEDDDAHDEDAAPRRKIWGNATKTYPGNTSTADEGVDLEALLSGVKKKDGAEIKTEDAEVVKNEQQGDEPKPVIDIPAAALPAEAATSTVMFKKRKGKK